jgi:acyl phosphate:glycerol-3-phosphate acyltransferase
MEFLLLLLAYLIGSIPTSLILGRVLRGIDVRDHGSGNAGATNTFRVLGPRIGAPVLVFDMFKGWLAIYLSIFSGLAGTQLLVFQIALAVVVIIGHVYPVFAGFRGGKGIASLVGVFLFLMLYPLLLSAAVFLITFLLTGYVSLGSILAGIALPILTMTLFGDSPVYLQIFATFISLFVVFTHRKNIVRLIKGEENRFSIFRKRKS